MTPLGLIANLCMVTPRASAPDNGARASQSADETMASLNKFLSWFSK